MSINNISAINQKYILNHKTQNAYSSTAQYYQQDNAANNNTPRVYKSSFISNLLGTLLGFSILFLMFDCEDFLTKIIKKFKPHKKIKPEEYEKLEGVLNTVKKTIDKGKEVKNKNGELLYRIFEDGTKKTYYPNGAIESETTPQGLVTFFDKLGNITSIRLKK